MRIRMNMRGTVKAVCISPTKGTAKQPVGKGIFIKEFGIENDAHAGEWHRQVSLLSYDSVIAFNEKVVTYPMVTLVRTCWWRESI